MNECVNSLYFESFFSISLFFFGYHRFTFITQCCSVLPLYIVREAGGIFKQSAKALFDFGGWNLERLKLNLGRPSNHNAYQCFNMSPITSFGFWLMAQSLYFSLFDELGFCLLKFGYFFFLFIKKVWILFLILTFMCCELNWVPVFYVGLMIKAVYFYFVTTFFILLRETIIPRP